MAGIEDPQQSTTEAHALVDRGVCDLVRQAPRTGLADPAAAEVVARRLGPVLSLERCIDHAR